MFFIKKASSLTTVFLLVINLFLQSFFFIPQATAQTPADNLIFNSTFNNNIDGWYRFNKDIKRDSLVCRGPSGASMYFPPNASSRTILWVAKIPVTAGHFYTFRAYLRSKNIPSAPILIIYSYDSSGNRIRYQNEWFSVSKANTWQEAATQYHAPKDASSVQLYIGDSSSTNNELWLDDVYFGQSKVVLEQPPSKKTPFVGKNVKIDSNGNFEVNQNGVWNNYFPFGIINTSLISPNWAKKFSNQGFNFSFGSYSSTLANLKAAKSKYNPNGMMMMGSIIYQTGYNTDTIKTYINNLKNSSASDAILGWYYEPTDGSQKLLSYPQIKKVYNAFKEVDTSRPVIWNLGQIGFARALGDTTDATGLFRYPKYIDTGGTKHLPVDELGSSFKIASNLEGVIKPNAIATISITDDMGNLRPTPAQLKALVYDAIIAGAKGIIFWWEKQADSSTIDTTNLWPIFPVLRNEIEIILPIIRQNSPSYSVNAQTQEENKRIDLLAKEYNGEPYIIVVNTEEAPVNAIFNFSGLSINPYQAKEIFGRGNSSFSKNSFRSIIEPYDTRVYRITATDTISPIVLILNPTNGSIASGLINITANATDNTKISKVEFYVDNILRKTVSASSCNYSFNSNSVADGTHSIKAVAYDMAGNSSSDSIRIIVNNTPPVSPPLIPNPNPKPKPKPKPKPNPLLLPVLPQIQIPSTSLSLKAKPRVVRRKSRAAVYGKLSAINVNTATLIASTTRKGLALKKVAIKARVISNSRKRRKARYKKLYLKYRTIYRKLRNKRLKKRYRKLSIKYKKAYKKVKISFYKTIKFVKTNSKGNFKTKIRFRKTLILKAFYGGGGSYKKSHSRSIPIRVKKAKVKKSKRKKPINS